MSSNTDSRRKILIVMGTRPEIIKMTPVITALKKRRACFETVICATGQHRQMADQMLKVFNIKPDFDLDLMRPNQTLPEFLQNSIRELNKVMAEVKPQMVVVQGDTITATAAALSAYYARVPVAHIEAGLRSHDRNNPFPEEANRLLIGQISELLFVPTKASCRNLERESFPRSRIFITGNTVIDTLKYSLKRIEKKIDCCNIPKGKKILLVTLHRRESFGVVFEGILKALKETVENNKKIFMIYPVHPNPNVQVPAHAILKHPRIRLIEPLPYLQFLSLMSKSDLIVTDSGGVQEEAPALNKPVLVLRNKTERSEAILAGYARLIGTRYDRVIKELRTYTGRICTSAPSGINIYGDGKAAERIVAILLNYFYPDTHGLPAEFENDIFLKDIQTPAQTIFAP
jgi:UDP-N-acetylglucosamine 2-epimerase (non-hydrolysing)